MKTKKIRLLKLLVLLIFVACLTQASAPHKIKITADIDYPYDIEGWAWLKAKYHFEPDTGVVKGLSHYKSHTGDPDVYGKWYGRAICGAMGEYEGEPAIVVVAQVVKIFGTMPEHFLGGYAKVIFVDGGPEGDGDLVGLVAWGADGPVQEMPSCDFEQPFLIWPPVNGDIAIHYP